MNPHLLFILMLICITSVCDTAGQLILKSSINAAAFEIDSLKRAIQLIFKLAFVPQIWIAFVLSCISLFLWLLVLSHADLSFAFSIDSIHYVLVALASRIFLKEIVDRRRWAGTILIVAGIVLVALSGTRG